MNASQPDSFTYLSGLTWRSVQQSRAKHRQNAYYRSDKSVPSSITLTTSKMSEAKLREFFDAADKDDNGSISTQELVNILTNAYGGDRDKALCAANELLEADTDGNKRITWDELVALWNK
ncbi:hypothetical protein LSH36_834g02044 [Paralvinella palmiformis]|uniref:EF-hand domain-containing protein n=1 Tax=Paralvinella palmiformis TaxID=53620 RepID=A0AAD9J0S5_9ANNE|nr:hypothetical protein LSH36_834g02044 [Paralvinella palmiformis]